MRKTILLSCIAALVLTIAGCASIPCAPPSDKATCYVAYYVAVSDQIDVNLQALVSGIPAIPANVRSAINAYHAALPGLQKAANDGLAAYEAGATKDYTTAVNAIISLYTDINAIITSAGYADQVAPAKAEAKVKMAAALLAASGGKP